jgi:hypothetical protein
VFIYHITPIFSGLTLYYEIFQGPDEGFYRPPSFIYKVSMSMAIVEQKPVTPLRCHRCKHEWLYGGKNPYYAMCPFCRTQLSIKKHRIEEDKK